MGVYGFDFYIAPHTVGIRALGSSTARNGCSPSAVARKIYGIVAAEKRPARWTYATLGWRPIRTLIRRRVLRSVVVLQQQVSRPKSGF
jgi:hypothetical protein